MNAAAKRELRKTAYHEAGHGVISIEVGRAVRYIALTTGHEQFAGVCCGYPARVPGDHVPTSRVIARIERDAERAVLTLLAGDVAERRFEPQAKQHGQVDFEQAAQWALIVSGDAREEAAAYLHWLSVKCARLVDEQWPMIVAVAEELYRRGERGRMTGREIHILVNDTFVRTLMAKRTPAERAAAKARLAAALNGTTPTPKP